LKRVSISKVVEKPISGEWGDEAESEIDGIPVIRNTNFSNDGRIDLHDVAFRQIPERKIKKKRLKPGDIIIEKSGGSKNQPVGRVVYFDIDDDKDYLFSNFTSAIRPRKEVEPKYVHYGLLHSYMRGGSELFQNKTTGIRNLKLKRYLDKVKIPLPSLSEQKAIVAKLDRAQRLIDIDKEMLAKYDELIQSVFLEMFGGVESEKVSLSELVKLNPRKSEISDIDKSMEASFLGMADVGENGSLNLSEHQTIEESWKGYTYFKEDDVLFAKITPCMENGKGAIAKGLRNGLGFGSTEFHVLRSIEGVSRSAWIYHLTHSDKFRKIAESFMTGSAGQKRVPTHFFDRFKVVKPSIEKQIQFEEIATEISEDKKRLRSQIKKSEELFSSLVQGAFG